MDIVDRLRPFSVVFLGLALFFTAIAFGVMTLPASPTYTGSTSDFTASGGNITDASWSFNPYYKTWHFSIDAGASYYQLVIQQKPVSISTPDGTYKADPYYLTVDLSHVDYALPMEPSVTPVYYYQFVDCGRQTVPYNAWIDLFTHLLNPLTGSLYDMFQSAAVRSAYQSAYQSCLSTVQNAAAHISADNVSTFVLLSVDKDTSQTISVLGHDITSPLYEPHFYGIIRYTLKAWQPKDIANIYPTGDVGITLQNAKGSRISATVKLPGPSLSSTSYTATASLGDIGSIHYVSYASRIGDVYPSLSSPYVVLTPRGHYAVIQSSDVASLQAANSRFTSILLNDADYIISTSSSFDSWLSRVGSHGLDQYVSEAHSVLSSVQTFVNTYQNEFNAALTNGWKDYVINAADVPNTRYLLLKPVTGRANAFVIKLSGDVNAAWIGLRLVVAHGKIVNLPSSVSASRSGVTSFTFGVQNVSDQSGSFSYTVSCGQYGTLASGQTSVVSPHSTVTVPVSGVLQGISNYSKPVTVKCTITLANPKGGVDDTAAVYVNYKPDVVCIYTQPTCGTQNGQQGYYTCSSPYSPAAFHPCPEGQVCKTTPTGAACVAPESSETNTVRGDFCKGGDICSFVNGKEVCKSCGDGYQCRYTSGQGATCKCVDPAVCGPHPAPTPKDVIVAAATPSKTELWRLGAGIAAVGSLIIWVVLL